MIAATNVPNTQYPESQIMDNHRRGYHYGSPRKLICLPWNILENILNSLLDIHCTGGFTRPGHRQEWRGVDWGSCQWLIVFETFITRGDILEDILNNRLDVHCMVNFTRQARRVDWRSCQWLIVFEMFITKGNILENILSSLLYIHCTVSFTRLAGGVHWRGCQWLIVSETFITRCFYFKHSRASLA